MNNQEPDLNPTPAETDSAKTNESVQRERSELPVDQRSSYLRSRQIALKSSALKVGTLAEVSLRKPELQETENSIRINPEVFAR